jgi:hypothetical protein
MPRRSSPGLSEGGASRSRPRLLYYRREHAEAYKAIQAAVIDRWKKIHEENPRYDFTQPSDADVIKSCEVVVEEIDAC